MIVITVRQSVLIGCLPSCKADYLHDSRAVGESKQPVSDTALTVHLAHAEHGKCRQRRNLAEKREGQGLSQMVHLLKTGRWLVALVLSSMIAGSGTPGETVAQTTLEGSSKGHGCSQSVRQKLVELGIDPMDIKGVSIKRREVRRRANKRVRRQHLGYKAWVVPRDGKGNLVMDLFLNCRVQRVYTSGGFTLPRTSGDPQ